MLFEDETYRRYTIFKDPRAIQFDIPVDCSSTVYANESWDATDEKLFGYSTQTDLPVKLSSLIDGNCEAQGLVHLQIRCPDSK